ncbi:MAG: hypothetical protein CMQ21_01745 [Gammaproteobacteria bacterium]|nr:hypothetical protein [Gammaproteobacteria bacterium]
MIRSAVYRLGILWVYANSSQLFLALHRNMFYKKIMAALPRVFRGSLGSFPARPLTYTTPRTYTTTWNLTPNIVQKFAIVVLVFLLSQVSVASALDSASIVYGSFSARHTAESVRRDLEQTVGKPLRIAEVTVHNRSYFRVLGAVQTDIPQLRSELKRVKSSSVPDAWLDFRSSDSSQAPLVVTVNQRSPPVPSQGTEDNTTDISEIPLEIEEPQRSGFWSLLTDTDFAFSGYLKSYATAQKELEIDQLPALLDDSNKLYQSQNSIRLMLDAFTGDKISWQLHYEISPVFYSHAIAGNPLADTTLTSSGNTYRLTDIKQTLGDPRSKYLVYQNLDRFNVQVSFDSGDLTIGRQVISLGSARMINPTDVLLPFNVTTLNQEYRTGIDMIRFQKPLGDLAELDLGIVLGEDADKDNSAVFARAQANWRGSDIAGTLIRFAGQNLVGIGTQSSIGNMGFWFESAYVWGDVDYHRSSVGVDYSFSTNVFGQMEYHRNGAGQSKASNYFQLADHVGYQKGGVFLLGKDYLIPSVSWTATPLLSLTASALFNLSDHSSFINLSGTYSLADELGMDFGIYLFTGDNLAYSPLPPYLTIQSEYGSSSNLAYGSIRYYF